MRAYRLLPRLHVMRIPSRLAARTLPLVLALALSFAPAALAQTATLRGFVTAESDGQPLLGVNVFLTDDDGALIGTATDGDGFYTLARVPSGTYRLQATFIGFQTYTETVTLTSGIVTRSIALEDSAQELDEVVVQGDRETAGGASVSAGLQTVRPSDIELIPSPDISADLVNYLTALPGIVSQGDRGGQLFIRGGEPTQNLVLLDGMLVYQPFHIVGFFSAFPSDIITTADVYAGGYSGKFGGRLSSVLDIATRNGNNRRFAGAVSVAPFVTAGRIEGPIIPGRVSFVASVRESFIENGAARLVDEPLPFAFGDAFGKIHARLNESVQVSVSALSTHDSGTLGSDPLRDDGTADPGDLTGRVVDEVDWTNQAIGGRFLFLPTNLPVLAEMLVSLSKFENAFGPQDAPTRRTDATQFSVSTNVTYYMANADVNWGFFLNQSRLENELGGQFQNVTGVPDNIIEAGAYIEPEIRVGSMLRVQPGLRVQTFPSKSRTYMEPRLRVVFEAGKHRLSGAAGLYHQQIVGLSDPRDAGDVFTAWASSPLESVPTATHYIAGYRLAAAKWMDLSLEGFYKNLDELFVSEWTAFPRFTTKLQVAEGRAYGFDARMEVRRSPFYALLTYGYADVEYEAPIPSLLLATGQSLYAYRPPHDRRHQLSATGNVTALGFDLSVRWQMGSGLPFNEALGFDKYMLLDSLVTISEVPGETRVLYQRPYTGRLPTYHRLDISLDREFNLSDHGLLTLQAGLINAYDRRNLFYLDLFTLRRVDQLPLLPTFGLKLELN